jgi:hypothetical protein
MTEKQKTKEILRHNKSVALQIIKDIETRKPNGSSVHTLNALLYELRDTVQKVNVNTMTLNNDTFKRMCKLTQAATFQLYYANKKYSRL